MSGAVRVPLEGAARALADLWAGRPGTVRMSSGTLLAVCDEARLAGVQAALDRLTESLPCRSVVVVLDDRAAGNLEADVGLVRRGSGAACERLVVRADRGRVVGAALPLSLPDMPVRLWWALPGPPASGLLREVAGDEVVIADSRDAGLESLGPTRRWWDLAWGRLRPWRDAIASPFDEPGRRARLGSLSEIALEHAAGPDEDARLVVGWIGDRLGWTGGRRDAGGLLARGAGGEVRATWRAVEAPGRAPGDLVAVELRCDGWSCRLQRQPAGPFAVVEVQPEAVTWRAAVEPPDPALLLGEAFGSEPVAAWDRAVERLRRWGLG